MSDILEQRLDKWLWFARFFKSRTLAAKLVNAGKLRLNGARVSKGSTLVRAGDALTFPQANRVRVIKIAALADRRGPAPEAQALYEDLDPPPPNDAKGSASEISVRKGARPTKKDRREMTSFRQSPLE